MKVYLTIERTLSRGYEIDVDSSDQVEEKALELMAQLTADPQQMEDAGESWDFAADDESGRTIIPWKD